MKIGSLFGAIFGAGGAAAYYNGAMDQGSFLNYVLGSPQWGAKFSMPQGAGGSGEIDSLTKMVERLSREVRSSSGAVTVIHGSNGSSAIFTYGGVILVSAMGIMYIRGWKFSDFLYVTRASLQKSMSGVTSSMEGLTKRMSTVKEIIGQQIDAVKRRQEDAMKAQEKLKEQMDTVGLDVESTRTNVEEVHTDLTKLGGDVEALSAQQANASEGIYLLCSVLGDIVEKSNIRSSALPQLNRYLGKSDNYKGYNSFLPDSRTTSLGSGRIPANHLLPAASSPSELQHAESITAKSEKPDNANHRPPQNKFSWGVSPMIQRAMSAQHNL